MSSKQSEPEDLLELKKYWYQKLKETGFKDIEDTNSPLQFLKVWESTNWFKQYSPESFQDRAEYFRLAGLFLHAFHFKSYKDREIWKMHSEGMSCRGISEALASQGIKAKKDSVRILIQKLVDQMRSFDFHDRDRHYQ